MDGERIIYVADVFCPWCYAFAPVIRQVAASHAQFPVTVVGGNLIHAPMTLQDQLNQSEDLPGFWREVERISGRSLAGVMEAARSGRHVELYSPGADEILMVLKQKCPGHELEQMIELEEMFYGRGENIFSNSSLGQIAKKWNLEPSSFQHALDQPSALESTQKNLQRAADLMGEIDTYPSVFLQRGSKIDAVTRGFVHLETVEARFEAAMTDLGLPAHPPASASKARACVINCR